jgi:hypothetical protein
MIDKLKLAIDRKDWGLVVEFYRQLTGTLEAPAVPEPSEKVLEVQRKGGSEDFTMRPVRQNIRPPANTSVVEKPKQKRGKKTPAKAKQIEFIDTGEVPDEPGFDKINDKVPPTPRNRKPFKTIKMTCIACNATEQINPIFKRDPECYKCNRCLTKGKMNGLE